MSNIIMPEMAIMQKPLIFFLFLFLLLFHVTLLAKKNMSSSIMTLIKNTSYSYNVLRSK